MTHTSSITGIIRLAHYTSMSTTELQISGSSNTIQLLDNFLLSREIVSFKDSTTLSIPLSGLKKRIPVNSSFNGIVYWQSNTILGIQIASDSMDFLTALCDFLNSKNVSCAIDKRNKSITIT